MKFSLQTIALASLALTTPALATDSPEKCAKKCNATYDACVAKPGANLSFCASQLIQCVGYNPLEPVTTQLSATACTKTETAPKPTNAKKCAKKCNATYDACLAKPDANLSFCASQLIQCVGYDPFEPVTTQLSATACSKAAAPTY